MMKDKAEALGVVAAVLGIGDPEAGLAALTQRLEELRRAAG